MNSLFTIGPRVGYAADRWLAFVGGGYARASIETEIKVPTTVLDKTDESHNGWYIGGGVKYLITRNISFGLEYQHVSLDTERHTSSVTTPIQRMTIDSSRDMSAEIDIIRARLTYRFGDDPHRPMK